MLKNKPKIIVIVGPTAVGKSAFAVALAKLIGGEVISADSRQIYRDLNIGTGKITRREMRGVPHYMLNVASPRTVGTAKQFTAEIFRTQAEKIIEDIVQRGNVPIICGGTGFYIDALVRGIFFPDVPPNVPLRKKLAHKNAAELYAMLLKKDPRRAATIDRHNPRRLIRALEIVAATGTVPHLHSRSRYTSLTIGLTLPPHILKEKIHTRLLARLRQGMIAEARHVHAAGLSYQKMELLGLEYRSLARFLQKKISRQEMQRELESAIWHYAKRQLAWFRRDQHIHWFPPDFKKVQKKINFVRWCTPPRTPAQRTGSR